MRKQPLFDWTWELTDAELLRYLNGAITGLSNRMVLNEVERRWMKDKQARLRLQREGRDE
jgi:hypothetical protein